MMIAQAAPDSKVALKVVRDGKEQVLTVKREELRAPGIHRPEYSEERETGPNCDELIEGVAVANLDSATRREFGIPGSVRGAIVTNVDPASLGAEVGLRAGNVIQEIDHVPVRRADEAMEKSRRRAGQRLLLWVWSNGSSHCLILRADRER